MENDNTIKTGALYIRVSTDKQEELSPDAQKRLLKDYAENHNIIISEEFIFLENGISGKLADKRPEFQRMIGIAKSKEHPIDVILVWKYSRFARNQEESIVYKSMLKKDNIDVVSISEPIIDGPFGTLIERIIEWMDEYYSIRLSGEVKRGMTENALRGKHQARAPYGYELTSKGLEINPETSKYIKIIFENYVYKRKSFYSIGKEITDLGARTLHNNYFDSRSIKYIISNPVYHGYVLWNVPLRERSKRTKSFSEGSILRKSTHEPIISDELFELAQKRLISEYTPNEMPEAIQRHWLSGIIRCSTCGKTLTSAGSNGGFQCGGYLKRKCDTSHYVKIKKLEEVIIKTIIESTTNKKIEYTNKLSAEGINELTILEDQLNKITQKEYRIKLAFQNGIDTIEEYKENKSRILQEKHNVEQKIAMCRNKKIMNNDKEMRNRIKNVASIITNPSSSRDEKNSAMKSIIDKIVYDKATEHIDIYFYFS